MRRDITLEEFKKDMEMLGLAPLLTTDFEVQLHERSISEEYAENGRGWVISYDAAYNLIDKF